MKQLDNNIDVLVKSSVDKTILEFDKNLGWEKLEAKRSKSKIRYLSLAIAASILLGIILTMPLKNDNINSNEMTEFEKRQKLIEYEEKISGTYVEMLLCVDCSGEIMKTKTKQVPENQWIIQLY